MAWFGSETPRILAHELVELAAAVDQVQPGTLHRFAVGVGLRQSAGGDLPEARLPDLDEEGFVHFGHGLRTSVRRRL
ncbi:hypothetical protein [Streptomyces xantholiticus]|uniref:Uncharacterized protein n=1 Tax=Streptomyces xantholiticus TaxID=68285 RepID=A0ABV1V664_9ACTN